MAERMLGLCGVRAVTFGNTKTELHLRIPMVETNTQYSQSIASQTICLIIFSFSLSLFKIQISSSDNSVGYV